MPLDPSEHCWGLLGSSPIPPPFVASCGSFQLRPLSSPGTTQDRRSYGPLRHPRRPGLPLASYRLILSITIVGFPCCVWSPWPACRANAPAGRMKPVRSYASTNIGLPSIHGGSAPASPVSGPAQRSRMLRPTDSPSRPSDPLHQRLQQLRRLHRRSSCYRAEQTSSRVGVSPTVDQRLCTAHAKVRLTDAPISVRRSHDRNRTTNASDRRAVPVGNAPTRRQRYPTASARSCCGCRLR